MVAVKCKSHKQENKTSKQKKWKNTTTTYKTQAREQKAKQRQLLMKKVGSSYRQGSLLIGRTAVRLLNWTERRQCFFFLLAVVFCGPPWFNAANTSVNCCFDMCVASKQNFTFTHKHNIIQHKHTWYSKLVYLQCFIVSWADRFSWFVCNFIISHTTFYSICSQNKVRLHVRSLLCCHLRITALSVAVLNSVFLQQKRLNLRVQFVTQKDTF